MTLDNKVVIITGAGGGVGKELCKLFVSEGARVIAADVNTRALEESLKNMEGSTHPGAAVVLDVSSADSWRSLYERVKTEFGRCDVLCNNAGVLRTGTLAESPLDDWHLQARVNVDGVILGCKTFSPMMATQGEGHIINVTSLSGMVGMPGWGYYTASKFASTGFTQCLAAELAESGVSVSVVCPGGIDTPMNDNLTSEMEERLLPPGEVAQLIVNEVKSEKPRMNIFTHSEYRELLAAHFQSILADYAHLD